MQLRIYRPNKQNKGAASKIEARLNDSVKEKVLSFWVATEQTGTDENGNAAFAWKDTAKTITFKLGTTDIGEILATINGRKTCTGVTTGKYKGMFHKNKTGNATFCLERTDSGYSLRMSKKQGEQLVRISHIVSDADAELLRIFLWQILHEHYNLSRDENYVKKTI